MPIRHRLRSLLPCLLLSCSGKSADPPAMPTSPARGVPLPMFQASSQLVAKSDPTAPWTLTASDGSGLVLTRVDAKAVFQGPLAFTELHLYFHNPEPRVREGTFAITLPAHAAVSRFAMENNGQWMEAEVVEKMLARRAYEDFLHRKQDPALLEKAEGNQFTARVFPIPASGDKHIVLSFSQELPGERYVLPLRGLPKVERIDATLDVLGADGQYKKQTLSQRNWLPDRDLVSDAPVSAEAIGSGTTVAAQLVVGDSHAAAADAPASLTVLVDTSASRALGFAQAMAGVEKLIEQVRKAHGDDLPIQVVAFDQETKEIFRGRAAEFGQTQVQALIARGAAGASDLGQALTWLAAHQPNQRVVVITDGVITAGANAKELTAIAKQLPKVERLDVALAGGLRDEVAAGELVRALPHPGAVLDLDAGVEPTATALDERVLVDVPVEVAGATWVYPHTIPSVRAGTRVMVYAHMPAPVQTIKASIDHVERAVGIVGATPALVERAAAAAGIAELEAQLDGATGDARTKLRGEIVKRSVASRVISSETSMLVLETARDYERYGIDRKALADIMVIGGSGIELQHRQPIADPPPPPPPQPARKLDGDFRAGGKSKVTKESVDELSKVVSAKPMDIDVSDKSVEVDEKKPEPPEPPATPAPVLEPPRAQPSTVAPAHHAIAIDSVPPAMEEPSVSREPWPPANAPQPLSGKLAEIDRRLRAGDRQNAFAQAKAWHDKEPGDVLALIALGDALEANKELGEAARTYGSIIDLFPARADLRRFAGERLERIGAESRALAIDTYRRAVDERPDHMTGHRLLAYALERAGQHAAAFDAILAGVDQPYPSGQYAGGDRVLAEDAGLIGASWIAADPSAKAKVVAELGKRKLALPTGASTRFILYWETDANDVDFHIQDAHGGHAWYSSKHLPSGGDLYADITTGYGPECFTIPGHPTAGPYRISINYYSQGPMGYGMGLLQIVRHDGKGHLAFEDRPYVIMTDHAYVDLGTYNGQ